MHPDFKLPPFRSSVDQRTTSALIFPASAPARGLMPPRPKPRVGGVEPPSGGSSPLPSRRSCSGASHAILKKALSRALNKRARAHPVDDTHLRLIDLHS